MRDILESAAEAAVALSEQRLNDGEINLGMPVMRMPHVGRQQGELIEDIMALLVPLIEPMDGEGMPEIVDARDAVSMLGLCQATADQDRAESLSHEAVFAFSCPITEKWICRPAAG